MDETAAARGLSWNHWRYLAPGALVVLAAGVVLYACPPDQYAFYPKCLFKTLTGWACPGCGGLRAAHELLHGRVGEALRLNPFMMVAGIWGVALTGWEVYRWRTRGSFGNPLRRGWVLWTMAILTILYGIARNIVGQ